MSTTDALSVRKMDFSMVLSSVYVKGKIMGRKRILSPALYKKLSLHSAKGALDSQAFLLLTKRCYFISA